MTAEPAGYTPEQIALAEQFIAAVPPGDVKPSTEEALRIMARGRATGNGGANDDAERRKPTQAEVLLSLARDAGVEPWATPEGDPYMTVPVTEHREHHRLSTRAARDWLARVYYADQERPPSAQALQDALGVLRGEALWGGSERHEAHVRYAAHGEATYLDLGDSEWRAVEIDREGWRIVSDPPVRFRRPRGLLSLPEPIRGGDLAVLRKLLNVDDHAWRLICGWLVGAMAPAGPYPVLGLHGEQGTAKSWMARLLRRLLDPNTALLRSEPRDERDLAIAANNGRIVALDNLSRLPDSLSDALCRLATGGGFATRELYSDSDEVIFSATRPAIITGIAEVATRGDLLDRSILVTLDPIPEAERLTEAEVDARWADVAPGVLGALLDATVTAQRRLPDTRPERLPRMADHARWVTAAEPALGWEPGDYLRVYGEARDAAVETALDASPLTKPIRELAAKGWEGTATELLIELCKRVEDAMTRSRPWPKSAGALSGALKNLAPDLRQVGIGVKWGKTTGTGSRKIIAIRMQGDPSDACDACTQDGCDPAPDVDLRRVANASQARHNSDDEKPHRKADASQRVAGVAKSQGRSSGGCASHPEPVAGCRYCNAAAGEAAK